jgi:hypothetical protein
MLDTLVDVIGHQIAVRSARVVSTDMLASSNIVQVYSQELGSVNALAGWMTWLLPDDVVFVAQPNNAEKYTPYLCIGFAGRPGGMREHFIVYDHRVVPSTANLPQRPRLGHLINVGGTQSADGTISGGVWHIYTRSGWSPLAGASQTATIAYMGQIIVNPPIRLPRNEWLRLNFPMNRSSFTALYVGSMTLDSQGRHGIAYTPTIASTFTFDATLHVRGVTNGTESMTIRWTLPNAGAQQAIYEQGHVVAVRTGQPTSAFSTITCETSPSRSLSIEIRVSGTAGPSILELSRINYTFSYSTPTAEQIRHASAVMFTNANDPDPYGGT